MSHCGVPSMGASGGSRTVRQDVLSGLTQSLAKSRKTEVEAPRRALSPLPPWQPTSRRPMRPASAGAAVGQDRSAASRGAASNGWRNQRSASEVAAARSRLRAHTECTQRRSEEIGRAARIGFVRQPGPGSYDARHSPRQCRGSLAASAGSTHVAMDAAPPGLTESRRYGLGSVTEGTCQHDGAAAGCYRPAGRPSFEPRSWRDPVRSR
eukprot:TRINITY_DN41723_c0_g1_i1.p1 TRINITY_DN41723_c0_g1~~TRINITY_DN41723_c0_g1_i1.p1  ORF type:complete len:209 (+),score=14.94 TRINITY_DN41723_c0_g1_i1:86-712(+)